MITCEQFEKDFDAWQKGEIPSEVGKELEQHTIDCPTCRNFSQGTLRLKQHFASLPRLEPSTGFKYRLNNRLKDYTEGRTVRTVFPRWAALGAGIVTGFALGLVVLVQNLDNNTGNVNTLAGASVAEHQEQLVGVTDTVNAGSDQDSIDTQESTYDPGRRARLVSGDK